MSLRISICIVVRNAVHDLTCTLASLDRHSRTLNLLPAEIVVVDGYSTDGGHALLVDWSRHFPCITRLVQQFPSGISPAMNLCAGLAQADWILFINAGDLLIDAAPLAPALSCAQETGARSIQFESAVFRPGSACGYWVPRSFPACHQSLVYRRDLHECCGLYTESFDIISDRLFDLSIRKYGRIQYPALLSATQVSPANASRDPKRLKKDWMITRESDIPFDIGTLGRLTFFLLKIEKQLGVSLSVWVRLWISLLMGRARLVQLG